MNKYFNIGISNPRYIDGRTLKKYYCKICQKLISWQTFCYGTKRCASCAKRNLKLDFVTKKWLFKEYILKNKSMQQIAKELKCDRSVIRRRFKTFKLKARTKSQSHLGIKRKPFTFKTRMKLRKKQLGIKPSLKTRIKMSKSYSKEKHRNFNKNTIIKHHINLNKRNNRKNNKLVLTASIHSRLHNRAYKYLVRKGIIKEYISWFFKYELNNKEKAFLQEIK